MMSFLIALLAAAAVAAQATPPATEIFVAPLTLSGDEFHVGPPENISRSPGYDNQPFFAPDGGSLFFTSARGDVSAKCGSPQTDVYRFDLVSRQLARVTDTPECEYSPTVTPGGQLSVIRVEADGTQRLWKFTKDGKRPMVVLPDVKPVGYHAWLDENTLVLFVLGSPATLQVADVNTGKAEIITSNIGQSIQKMPGGGVSFVQQTGEGQTRMMTITEVTSENGKIVTRPLTPAVEGARQAHVAWTPDGTLLMAHNGTLHAWRQGQTGWRAVADLTKLGLRAVTRMAVSPQGDRIAFVATP